MLHGSTKSQIPHISRIAVFKRLGTLNGSLYDAGPHHTKGDREEWPGVVQAVLHAYLIRQVCPHDLPCSTIMHDCNVFVTMHMHAISVAACMKSE